ncbi:MAG: hypothetical protein ABSH36_11455, partial [Solirubrobacteraceae bacterium]
EALEAVNVTARRDDDPREHITITATRLLARRPDGQGRYYQFLGWSPRRYRTWATVIAIENTTVTLVLPEWHPTRPVRLPIRLLPPSAHTINASVALTANLSAPTAGKLAPASITNHRHPPNPKHRQTTS